MTAKTSPKKPESASPKTKPKAAAKKAAAKKASSTPAKVPTVDKKAVATPAPSQGAKSSAPGKTASKKPAAPAATPKAPAPAPTAANAKPASKARRARRSRDVSGQILAELSRGPRSGGELIQIGGYSMASLYLNIARLKKEGKVIGARDGHKVVYSLPPSAGAAAAAPSLPAPRTLPSTKPLVGHVVPRVLHEALESLKSSLKPIENAEQKTLVLEQLAATMPGPIAAVLAAVALDVRRFSA